MRLSLLGVIGRDADVAQATRSGRTLLEACPGPAVSLQYRSIAARLDSSAGPVPVGARARQAAGMTV